MVFHFGGAETLHVVAFFNFAIFWVDSDDVVAEPNVGPDQTVDVLELVQVLDFFALLVADGDRAKRRVGIAINDLDLGGAVGYVEAEVLLATSLNEVRDSPAFLQSLKETSLMLELQSVLAEEIDDVALPGQHGNIVVIQWANTFAENAV